MIIKQYQHNLVLVLVQVKQAVFQNQSSVTEAVAATTSRQVNTFMGEKILDLAVTVPVATVPVPLGVRPGRQVPREHKL